MRLRVLGLGDDMMSPTARWSWETLGFSAIMYCSAQQYGTSSTANDEGTTVGNRMGAARITLLRLWSIQETGQKPCWNLGLQCPRLGTPGLKSTTRIRTRGISPRVFLRSLAETRENPLQVRSENGKHRRCQPVRSLVGHLWVCNVPFGEHQSSSLWACSVLLWEHKTSGARCESKPEVSRLESS